jgi:hypothetical protein
MENPSFDIFYHRGNAYDYESCGPDVDSATLSNNSKWITKTLYSDTLLFKDLKAINIYHKIRA